MAIRHYDGTVSHVGCVYNIWERNGAWDSDFYADCINVENGTVETIEYDTTRCGGSGDAEIDITAENYALYLHNGGKQNELNDAIKSAARKAKVVEKGKEVVVVKGRKVAHGVVGTVFWTKVVNYDKYGRSFCDELKIGIKDADGNVYWTYEKNVQVVDYKRYMDVAKIKQALAKHHSKNYQALKNEVC